MSKAYADLCGEFFHEIYPMIEQENRNQLQKWGVQKHDLFKWLAFTTEELGEVSKALCEMEFRGGGKHEVINECVQTITLLMKIIEMVDNEEVLT